MYLKEEQLKYIFDVSFYFFLLCSCTTEQCLAYRERYAYHSLRNPSLANRVKKPRVFKKVKYFFSSWALGLPVFKKLSAPVLLSKLVAYKLQN
jgi:hypothetical protein